MIRLMKATRVPDRPDMVLHSDVEPYLQRRMNEPGPWVGPPIQRAELDNTYVWTWEFRRIPFSIQWKWLAGHEYGYWEFSWLGIYIRKDWMFLSEI